MITKIHQSKNLSGTMRYVYQEYKGAEVIDTSCMRDDLEGAQAEIAQVMEQRPEIKKPVFHAILSVPVGDELTNDQWHDIASEYTQRMGFEGAPYVAVRHMDTEHHHIHIVASRVDAQGQLISDSFEKYRSQEIARDLEIKHGLTRVPSSWEVPERAPTQAEYHGLERTGQESARDRMREAISSALERYESAPEFARELARQDIKLVPKTTQDERIVGVYFEHEGTKIPGSKISRDYSWPKLSERLGYEHERDYGKLTRAPEHDASRPSKREEIARETPAREVTRGREILRNTTPRQAPIERPRREVMERRPTPDAPRRQPRVIERPTPQKTSPSPSPREETRPTMMRSPEAPSSPPASPSQARELRENTRDVGDEALTIEQAKQRMASALEKAEYARGWERWAESVRAQGVEPVPKGTQSDPTRVRGMYFEAGGHAVPGSQVDRSYSIKGLEGRLGAYDASRDAKAFRVVEVPGRGREEMPQSPVAPAQTVSATPHAERTPVTQNERAPEPQPPQDTVRLLVERLQASGVTIEVEPERFEGQWRGAYQDAQGGTWGAISRENTVALVKLEQGERVIEAERGERGEVVPKQLLPSHDSLSTLDHIEWRNEGVNKAILKVEPAPAREQNVPTQTTPERTRTLEPPAEPQAPESPTPRAEREQNEPSEVLDMTAEQWVREQREQGERARVLEVGQTVRGELQSEKLELRDGSYHVIESVGGSSVLVKARDELEAMRREDETPKVSVRIRRDQSLAVSEITRDRGRER